MPSQGPHSETTHSKPSQGRAKQRSVDAGFSSTSQIGSVEVSMEVSVSLDVTVKSMEVVVAAAGVHRTSRERNPAPQATLHLDQGPVVHLGQSSAGRTQLR